MSAPLAPTQRVEDAILYQGDVLDVLRQLPAGSVHCVITSPPYFNLRDYSYCDCALQRYANAKFLTRDGSRRRHSGQLSTHDARCRKEPDPQCPKCCGSGRIEVVKDKQIGLENSPEEFVQALVRVFGELRRVLRDDGVAWLNLGDSYVTHARGNKAPEGGSAAAVNRWQCARTLDKSRLAGCKLKDLLMMPARTALALQAEGWFLRAALPWCKRSPMPESCSDRPATALEWVFQLTKCADYFFDLQAVRQLPKSLSGKTMRERPQAGRGLRSADLWFESIEGPHGLVGVGDELLGLDVVTSSYSGAHFAAFPQALVQPLLLTSTSQRGCCAACGAPYVRQTKKQRRATRPGLHTKVDKYRDDPEAARRYRTKPNRDPQRHVTDVATLGWQASCACRAKVVPCVVLDPFAGHCTVGLVAQRYQRAFVGIDVNPEYLRAGAERLRRRGRGDRARRLATETDWLEELQS